MTILFVLCGGLYATLLILPVRASVCPFVRLSHTGHKTHRKNMLREYVPQGRINQCLAQVFSLQRFRHQGHRISKTALK